MKRKLHYTKLLIMMLGLWMFAGCVVHSVRPFYTPELLVDVPEFIGQWTLVEGNAQEDLNKQFTFTKDTLIPPDSSGKSGVLTIHLFRIDDMLFLDLIATDPPQCNTFWWVAHVTPVHSVAKVVVAEKTLRIMPLSSSWLEGVLKSGSVILPAIWHDAQNAHVFTASSAEWVAFLMKYGKDAEAFRLKDAFVFTKS